METIKSYLENMFRNLPQTEEISRMKSELLSNMEDKYHELKSEGKAEHEAVGIVISEFGNIDELLEEMNIEIADHKETYPEVSSEEAREFIKLKRQTSFLIGIGVTLILTGVSLLVFLSQLIENQYIFQNVPLEARGSLPVIFLFLLIAPAVGLFVYSGIRLERYKYIEEGRFTLAASLRSFLSDELKDVSPRQHTGTIIGVILCVLSPLAIFVGSLFGENASVYGVSILLLMVAAAVFIFITTGTMPETYKRLLKIEEFNPERKKQNKLIGAVAGIIWPLAVCIFLFSGFVFGLWHIAWVVFPITGILFGGFCAFYSIINSN